MKRSVLDRESARRVAPFGLAALVGLAVAMLPPVPPALNVVLAAALLGAIAICSLTCAWAKPPAPLAVVPPLAFLLLIGVLRGDSGTGTGFGPMALLPVFWIALYGLRWQLSVVLAGVVVLFALPLTGLVGDGYRAVDLRYAISWLAVSAVVGFSAQRLVSREREQRRSLARHRDFLDAMFAAAGALVAVIEPDGRVSSINPACERLGGFAEWEIAGRNFWEVVMPPEQAAATGRWWADAEPSERPGVVELPMVSRDGESHLVHWTLEALRGRDGEVVSFVATGLDVTAQRDAEAALAESEFQLRTLISNLPDTIVALYDRDLRCLALEGPILAQKGIRAEEFLGRRLWETVPAENAAVLQGPMEAALRGEVASTEYESQRDGTVYEVELVPYRREGEIRGTFMVARDVTRRKRIERELQHLAEHDPLTGLLNRRRFEIEVRRHLNYIARYGDAGALLVLDVDALKTVNDSLGHARGDELIVTVAGILEKQLRVGDSAARLGGDEFAVLLPAADRTQAETTVRRLIAAVRERGLLAPGDPPQPITVSIGATILCGADRLRPEQPLIEADRAMYEAKAGGGDDFRFHREVSAEGQLPRA